MSTEGETLPKFLSHLQVLDMLVSAVSVLDVAQPSSEVLEGLMNYPVYINMALCALPRMSIFYALL
jgi:hypothetical protein